MELESLSKAEVYKRQEIDKTNTLRKINVA